MTPPERELVNYLLAYKDPAQEIPLSHADIARILRCSHETIRRRHRDLEKRHPELKRLFAAVRHRGAKELARPSAMRRADLSRASSAD
jgi:hypothetical protein